MSYSDSKKLPYIYTNSFLEIIKQEKISLIISSKKTEQIIIINADQDQLNLTSHIYNQPTAIAFNNEDNQQKLAIATKREIWELSNNSETAKIIEPLGKYDACFIPKNIQVTGDINVLDMSYIQGELWLINNRFSCLCTLDKNYSFIPRWNVDFINRKYQKNISYLNGLAIENKRPKYITALEKSKNINSGIIIDIETDNIILDSLSLPNFPRFYQGKLWFLESGKGHFSYYDINSKKPVMVTQLPCLTTGLDFAGNFAFIGLSKVNINKQYPEAICGITIININTGEMSGFLRFQNSLNDLFSLSILNNINKPKLTDWQENLIATSYSLPPNNNLNLAKYYYNQGNNLYEKKQFQEAIFAYKKCLELTPDFLIARYNLGVVLGDVEYYDEAIIQLKEVIKIEPNNSEAHNSLGYIYSQKTEFQTAIYHYQEAIKLQSNYAQAHYNLGMILLKIGDFQRGWPECEYRWQTKKFCPFVCPQPQWKGEKISDKTLLIHTEQGAGDTIQFIRYIPLVRKICGKIIVFCPENLKDLLATVQGIDELYTEGNISLNKCDYYIPLMSLPYVFNTTLETIPLNIPYFKLSEITENYQINSPKLKVGLTWAGSTTHVDDHNRSCKLRNFLPFFKIPNIEFYSLQIGEKSKELNDLSPEIKIIDLSQKINNYLDTANIIKQLDLIITVDTSIAHLGGALGVKVWTLLCYNPDWRWLMNINHCPWYPNMRLFRQSEPKNWLEVMEKVAQELGKIRE